MASQARLEASLRRSARLGLEVLERASRRSVDGTSPGTSQTPTTAATFQHPHSELDDVFETVAFLMRQMTCQCKKFYESGFYTEPSNTEETHISRFHRPTSAKKIMPTLSKRKYARSPRTKDQALAPREDFFIEVSPGTYVVTASMPESQQQMQMISVKEGESIDLTFNLHPD